jgi:hypothetical protein
LDAGCANNRANDQGQLFNLMLVHHVINQITGGYRYREVANTIDGNQKQAAGELPTTWSNKLPHLD